MTLDKLNTFWKRMTEMPASVSKETELLIEETRTIIDKTQRGEISRDEGRGAVRARVATAVTNIRRIDEKWGKHNGAPIAELCAKLWDLLDHANREANLGVFLSSEDSSYLRQHMDRRNAQSEVL